MLHIIPKICNMLLQDLMAKKFSVLRTILQSIVILILIFQSTIVSAEESLGSASSPLDKKIAAYKGSVGAVPVEVVHTVQPHEEQEESASPPPVQFATENSTVVTAQTGSTALVPCIVKNIGDGMVSWIRRKDYHLLTVGLTTYSSDDRYQAVHAQHSEDWTLQVKFVQQRDAGLYECQVSSHPPMSIFVELRVVEAKADILGPTEKYLKSGSTLKLACVLRQSTEPPLFVFWYHNNRMINYDADRGVNVSSDEGRTSSTLVISSARRSHSGNYSCVPNNAQPASTYVHVLNGENPAAMQTGGRGLSWLRSPSVWLLVGCVMMALSSGRGSTLEPAPSRRLQRPPLPPDLAQQLSAL